MDVKRVTTQFSYSSAVSAGNFVFLGLHRGRGSDFSTQCSDTLANLGKTLASYGLELSSLVKVNVWLRNIKDLPEMEKLFNNYFNKDEFPARMTASTEFIDADCLIMIDGIAYRN